LVATLDSHLRITADAGRQIAVNQNSDQQGKAAAQAGQQFKVSHDGGFPFLLSDRGKLFASESFALNSGHLWWQFLQCVTWRTLSIHPAPECEAYVALHVSQ
jgi:hypothetical protein